MLRNPHEIDVFMPAELARMFGVPERRMYRWCERDGLPVERRGRLRMFVRLHWFAHWLEHHRYAWTSPPDETRGRLGELIDLGAAAWLRREMPDRMQTQELAGVTQ
jgi:hypothetical protein